MQVGILVFCKDEREQPAPSIHSAISTPEKRKVGIVKCQSQALKLGRDRQSTIRIKR